MAVVIIIAITEFIITFTAINLRRLSRTYKHREIYILNKTTILTGRFGMEGDLFHIQMNKLLKHLHPLKVL